MDIVSIVQLWSLNILISRLNNWMKSGIGTSVAR